MHRLWFYRQAFSSDLDRVILSGSQNKAEVFLKSLFQLFNWHTIGRAGTRVTTSGNTKINASIGEKIQGGDLLR